MRTTLSRVLDLVLRRSRDERLEDEIQAHLDLLADEYTAKGLPRHEAELAARKAFGGVDQLRERYRDQRGLPFVDAILQDVRYALRLIARDRWFTAATVFALALGIGVTSTMATLIYCMNFRSLPFDRAHELVGIYGQINRGQGSQLPYGVFDGWRSASRSFSSMAAEVDAPINLGDETHATDQFGGTFMTHDTFAVLRVNPALGRAFTARDAQAGAPPVVIIGYRLWADRFGSDTGVIGRTVRANGQTATVIGVMPEGFSYPVDTQVWRLLSALPGMDTPAAAARPVRIVARLASNVAPDQARAELAAILSTLPVVETEGSRRTIILPLNETYVGKVTQPAPMMMMAAVVVVLLIACSHAASLFLARAAARAREMSMRAALGAGRARLVRQLLVESVITALIAGIAGTAIAALFVRAFANEVSGFGLPYWTRFTFDAPIVVLIAAIAMATGVLFGLLPAMHLSRTNLAMALNQGGRGGGPREQRVTVVLLVGELALTVILLSTAAALQQSAAVVYRADQTIDVANVWTFRVALPPGSYATVDQRVAFYQALDARLSATPGMESAALANGAPFNARDSRGIVMDSEAPMAGSLRPEARLVAIGDRYFDTLGLKVLRGRRFEDLEPAARATAALVNDSFAKRFSEGVDPVGRDILLFNERTPQAAPRRVTIVGIAPPLRQQVAAGHGPVVYVPYETHTGNLGSIVIRGRPERFADALRQEVRRLDPDLPLFDLQSLERVSYNSRWIQRITGAAFSIVAILATLLSALGLYALTAYAASQRTQEIGVRMALGARRSQVSWLLVRRTLRHTSFGLIIGLAGAVATGALLQSQLVEVRANHPAMLGSVSVLLVVVAIAAALLPARRASRLDPVAALRLE